MTFYHTRDARGENRHHDGAGVGAARRPVSRFPNRSKFVQEAVREQLQRLDRSRLAREAAKLDPKFEQQLADEALGEGIAEWPEY